MLTVHKNLKQAVLNHAEEDTLRGVCLKILRTGVKSEELLEEFETLRETVEMDEDYEDTILDVMDSLCGWCSPNYALTAANI